METVEKHLQSWDNEHLPYTLTGSRGACTLKITNKNTISNTVKKKATHITECIPKEYYIHFN